MNTDTYIEKGSTHTICEDYAVAGQFRGSGYALVSDGCSASQNVDFGARILVHAAKDKLLSLLEKDEVLQPDQFARETITKAAAVKTCFTSLPETMLDATLLMAVVRPTNDKNWIATVWLWGDGMVLVRKDERLEATGVRFGGNAPYYLSYHLNPDRNRDYVRAQKAQTQFQKILLDLDGNEMSREEWRSGAVDPLQPNVANFELREGDALALASDGITQFLDEQGALIPLEQLVPQFIRYKQTTGVFLRRRMNFFGRENSAAGVTHLDDLGIAAIAV